MLPPRPVGRFGWAPLPLKAAVAAFFVLARDQRSRSRRAWLERNVGPVGLSIVTGFRELVPSGGVETVRGALMLWLARPGVGKRALLAVAWGFIPRRFKLIAGSAAAFALIVLAGSVAALVLALSQLA